MMSVALNPYRDWLGVEPSGKTPTYYELLGLVPLEADMAKINAAYQRQSGKLAARLSGSQAEVAQRLMGELADARMTLMTPTAKRAYDHSLAARVHGPSIPAEAAPTAANVDHMLPPTASPQSTGPSVAAQPYAPVHGPAQGYAAAPIYGAPQVYPATPGYSPAQAYPGWQPQPVAPTASYPAAGYYPAPQQASELAPVAGPFQPAEATSMPVVRRRPARRRSSGMPALIGVAVVVTAVIGGLWYHFKGSKTVAEINPNQVRSVTGSSPTKSTDDQPQGKPAEQNDRGTKVAANSGLGEKSGRDLATPKPMSDANMPGRDTETPSTEKTVPKKTKPLPDESQPDKPQPDKPEPEKPKDEPKRTETKASPEEAAAVGKILKSARAALANRDLSKAQDLLAEATIEATASDTLAEVNRVETLTSYVEMFWDAARKTLPKLQAAENIEIDGAMIAVVEADEDRLVVRVEGRNRDYTWQKIPAKIAYYLANRWLAPADPLRNMVLAAFEIVDPKGDLNQAQTLLDNASAANLKAGPLIEELKAARDR